MFSHVVCGGTFDRFHTGHEALIRKCFEEGKKVTIGITSQKMALQKLNIQRPEVWSVRAKRVRAYVNSLSQKAQIIKLHDIYGPTLLEHSIDAIVVTKETAKGANLINTKRLEIGMKPLSVVVIDLKKGDDSEVISSSRIRKGYINRHGESYREMLFSRKIFNLPKVLIPSLRMPLGRSFSSVDEYIYTIKERSTDLATVFADTMWITVGDVVTYEFLKRDLQPTFSVIDKRTLRKALNQEYLQKIVHKDCLYALNEKGTISSDAISKLNKIINLEHKGAIKQLIIRGEEDLLVLPIILMTPLGTEVIYGLREKGIVVVEVTEKTKQKVYNLLKLFD